MQGHLPPLGALRAFETAARLNSFMKAAEELHVTPAAISHQIHALEADLGVSLFHRLNRQVELTPSGDSQVLGGIRQRDLVRSVSPVLEGKLVYLRHGNRVVPVRAAGEIPSRAGAVVCCFS